MAHPGDHQQSKLGFALTVGYLIVGLLGIELEEHITVLWFNSKHKSDKTIK